LLKYAPESLWQPYISPLELAADGLGLDEQSTRAQAELRKENGSDNFGSKKDIFLCTMKEIVLRIKIFAKELNQISWIITGQEKILRALILFQRGLEWGCDAIAISSKISAIPM